MAENTFKLDLRSLYILDDAIRTLKNDVSSYKHSLVDKIPEFSHKIAVPN